jgi:cytochrome o ubiquinol oxidase subunit 1
VQLIVSIRAREELRDVTGDPWNGRTLEWSIPSPPPAWNFAVMPRVAGLDAYWSAKQRSCTTQGEAMQARVYEKIEMPKNSPIGFASRSCITPRGIIYGYHFHPPWFVLAWELLAEHLPGPNL